MSSSSGPDVSRSSTRAGSQPGPRSPLVAEVPVRRRYGRALLRLSLFWAAAIVLVAALYGAAWVILIDGGY